MKLVQEEVLGKRYLDTMTMGWNRGVVTKEARVNSTIVWKSNGMQTEGGSSKVPIVRSSTELQ